MQVQFTPNELEVLADTLARHNRELLLEIARSDHREFRHMLQMKLARLTHLESQLAQGELQLSAEETDILMEVLDTRERALYFEIARTDDGKFRRMLQSNLDWLEGAHCKIAGASAAA